MIDALDRCFCRVRATPFFWRMTLLTRILLAAAFIPTGLVKLLGHRFTLISPETPIGAFFEAMYQTGMYWQFLGLAQVVAGILLLVPSAAHLGAFLFAPIIGNIFVITIALGFRGTPVVTGLMVLAALYLCAWDYHRWRSLVTTRPWPADRPVAQPRLDWMERIGFQVFAVSLLVVMGATRSVFSSAAVLVFLGLGIGAGLFTLLRFLWVGRRLVPPDTRASTP